MPRHGYALVELLAVIAIGAVLMGAAIEVLYLLSRAERGGRSRAGQAMIVARLADQFRSDVHAARPPAALASEEKNPWQFTLSNDRVAVYRALPGEIQRIEQVRGRPVRQESYALPEGSTVEIAVRAEPAPAMAGLVITLPGPGSELGRDIRVEAAFGRDRRFAHAEKEPGT